MILFNKSSLYLFLSNVEFFIVKILVAVSRSFASPSSISHPLTIDPKVDKLLVVAPHCDDETLGCAGLLAYSASHGIPCKVVVLSHDDIRMREVYKSVVTIVGRYGLRFVSLAFETLPDHQMREKKIQRVLDKYLLDTTITKVFVTDPRDLHPDHQALGYAALKLKAFNEFRLFFYCTNYLNRTVDEAYRIDFQGLSSLKRLALINFDSQKKVISFERCILFHKLLNMRYSRVDSEFYFEHGSIDIAKVSVNVLPIGGFLVEHF